MAGELVEDSTVRHTFVYDLESTFYVLLWQSVYHIWSCWTPNQIAGLEVLVGNKVQLNTGDRRKIAFMASSSSQLRGLEFYNCNTDVANPDPKYSPLGKLLRDFARLFLEKYSNFDTSDLPKEIMYTGVLDILSGALKQVNDWPTTDFVKKVEVTRPKLQQDDTSYRSSRSLKRSRELRHGEGDTSTSSRKRLNSGLFM